MQTYQIMLIDVGFLVGFIVAAYATGRRFLQFFQQEEYDSRRYLSWWVSHRAIERRATLTALLVGGVGYWLSVPVLHLSVSMAAIVLIALLGWSNDTSRTSKKPLVMTPRARRILLAGLILLVLAFFLMARLLQQAGVPELSANSFAVAGGLLLLPVFLMLGNAVLLPLELTIQRGFRREAEQILRDYAPDVIGITGSYGKTSTKHILAHVLNVHAPTLATPGSVNTVMGITRIIRERLKPDHRFFISEMGAYGIGSIQRLCNLTPPRIAIVTAVGWAHYERFKSLEAVQQAKSELPHSIPEEGFAVLNGDYPHVRNMEPGTKGPVYFYGEDTSAGRLDLTIRSSTVTPEGITCEFDYEQEIHRIQMPVFGKHMVSNAAAAFLTAMKVGVAPITVIAALRTLPQVDHRLVVKQVGGITVIDDAYNSNPVGFRSALEVLKVLPGGRKVVVTPGMVELGAREDEEYRSIAPEIAEVSDLVVLVAASRLNVLEQALRETNLADDQVRCFDTLAEARVFLDEKLVNGDVVLYENDLPDLYESDTPFRW